MKKHEDAFTLLELLVIIALVAVLAALLFPVFGVAREKVRQANCASNLRQIGMAVSLYKSDYDDLYPLAIHNWQRIHGTFIGEPFTNDFKKWPAIQDILQPYVKSTGIFHCPSDIGLGNPPTGTSAFLTYGSSYMIDARLAPYKVLDSQLKNPARYLYAEDLNFDWHTYQGASFYDGRGNVLFLDNHVKFTQSGEAFTYSPLQE